ncbi:MAG: tautomerase family protein [Acidobacteriota bacterium]
MPLYICNATQGTIDDEHKQAIAKDITRIHCDVTGAPPQFVHTFFFEDAPTPPLDGKSASLFGSIRAGRTDEQKKEIIDSMTESIHRHAGVALDDINAITSDIPASWVMEGGDIFPEPGEEAEWLEKHEAKHAAEVK